MTRRTAQDEPHAVYALALDGDEAVKIGITVNPSERKGAYVTGSWRTPRMLAIVWVDCREDALRLERLFLTKLFAKEYIKGEWVRRSAAVEACFATSASMAATALELFGAYHIPGEIIPRVLTDTAHEFENGCAIRSALDRIRAEMQRNTNDRPPQATSRSHDWRQP